MNEDSRVQIALDIAGKLDDAGVKESDALDWLAEAGVPREIIEAARAALGR